MNRSAVRATVLATTLLVSAGCGAVPVAPSGPATSSSTSSSEGAVEVHPADKGGKPPTVTLTGPDRLELTLEPWTWCWSEDGNGACADGGPPADPPDVGAPTQVLITHPEPGWTFRATFAPADPEAGEDITVDMEPDPDGAGASAARLSPAGFSGTYDVHLFGDGPQGSVATTFRWSTPVDGPQGG